jgi:hypothetical protein
MEILEAYDLLQSIEGAARMAGCDPKTVRRYVMDRDLGRDVADSVHRAMLVDSYMAKVEEWVDRSKGRVRADVVHRKLQGMGYTGSERTTRRAVAETKEAWAAGRRTATRRQGARGPGSSDRPDTGARSPRPPRRRPAHTSP